MMMYSETFIQGNHSENRTIKPKGVILHHTGLVFRDGKDITIKSVINTFTNPKSKASAHVLICKDGKRISFGEDTQRMWHSGISEFKGLKYCNNYMLGVEFEGDTNINHLTYAQIESFIEWVIPRIEKYKFTIDWVTDHRTVSPGRKVDLNEYQYQRVLMSIKYLWL